MDIPKILNEVIGEEKPTRQIAQFARNVVDLECNENTRRFTDKYDALLEEAMKEELV